MQNNLKYYDSQVVLNKCVHEMIPLAYMQALIYMAFEKFSLRLAFSTRIHFLSLCEHSD